MSIRECRRGEEVTYLTQHASNGMDVPPGLDSYALEFPLEDPPYAINFPDWQGRHEVHNGLSIALNHILPVGFFHVTCDLREGGIGPNAS